MTATKTSDTCGNEPCRDTPASMPPTSSFAVSLVLIGSSMEDAHLQAILLLVEWCFSFLPSSSRMQVSLALTASEDECEIPVVSDLLYKRYGDILHRTPLLQTQEGYLLSEPAAMVRYLLRAFCLELMSQPMVGDSSFPSSSPPLPSRWHHPSLGKGQTTTTTVAAAGCSPAASGAEGAAGTTAETRRTREESPSQPLTRGSSQIRLTRRNHWRTLRPTGSVSFVNPRTQQILFERDILLLPPPRFTTTSFSSSTGFNHSSMSFTDQLLSLSQQQHAEQHRFLSAWLQYGFTDGVCAGHVDSFIDLLLHRMWPLMSQLESNQTKTPTRSTALFQQLYALFDVFEHQLKETEQKKLNAAESCFSRSAQSSATVSRAASFVQPDLPLDDCSIPLEQTPRAKEEVGNTQHVHNHNNQNNSGSLSKKLFTEQRMMAPLMGTPVPRHRSPSPSQPSLLQDPGQSVVPSPMLSLWLRPHATKPYSIREGEVTPSMAAAATLQTPQSSVATEPLSSSAAARPLTPLSTTALERMAFSSVCASPAVGTPASQPFLAPLEMSLTAVDLLYALTTHRFLRVVQRYSTPWLDSLGNGESATATSDGETVQRHGELRILPPTLFSAKYPLTSALMDQIIPSKNVSMMEMESTAEGENMLHEVYEDAGTERYRVIRQMCRFFSLTS